MAQPKMNALKKMKLTNREVTEAIQEFKLEKKALAQPLMHPYWGLKDSRGYLSRFNSIGQNLLPREWVQKFLNFGGSFDAQRHYGISPYSTSLAEFDPRVIAHLTSITYWGFLPISPQEARRAGYELTETITLKELITLARAIRRKDELKQMGVEWDASIGKLGYMKPEKWQDFVMSKVNFDNYKGINLTMTPNASKEAKKLLADGDKHTKRLDLHRKGRGKTYDYNKPFSKKALIWAIKNGKTDKLRLTMKIAEKASELKGSRYVNLYTSVGDIYRIPNTNIIWCNSDISNLRQVGEYQVCNLRKVWFCFFGGDDLNKHREGRTLAEAVKNVKSITAIKGLEMSLYDVWKATRFCFAGTKNFLRNKMPHVYRLVAQYDKWELVPQDILDIKWTLVSREIFNGYSQP